jgi:hypothetical protein
MKKQIRKGVLNVAQCLGKVTRVMMIRGTLTERAYKKRDDSDGISLDLFADVVAKVII